MVQETGTVKWFDGEKGYGFIRPDEGAEDLFVHHTGVAGGKRALREGDKVTYEVVEGRRGPQAQNVSKVPDESGFGMDTLEVPVEVEVAATVLVEHFDPDELYEAMIRKARRV